MKGVRANCCDRKSHRSGGTARCRGGDAFATMAPCAARGGNGAEQGHQIMSGVWVLDKKISGASRLLALPRVDPGRGGAAYQHTSAELSQRQAVSGRGKNRLRAGAQLLLLPRGVWRLPHRRVSGGRRVVKSSAFPIISRAFSFCWAFCWGASSAVFSAPSAGCRSACTRSPRKSFPQRSSNP